MALFQWQKVDPPPEEVEHAVGAACRAARRRPTLTQRREAFAGADRAPSGSVFWGSGDRRATCAWWTDHAGRRHWFVEGDEYRPHGEPDPLWRCRRVKIPPLAVIDPLHVALRGQGPGAPLLVLCDCGEVGTPEALGWMGDCCAPCFDRRAEGVGTAARLAVRAHATAVIAVAFARDGRVLSVGFRHGGVHLHDPLTGRGARLAEPSEGGGAGGVTLPDGSAVVAFTRGEVVCWDVDSGEERWRVRCPGELMGLSASLDGERLAVDGSLPHLLGADGGECASGRDELSNFTFGPGRMLYAYDSDSRGVVAFDPRQGPWTEVGLEFGEPEEDDCYALACSPVRQLLAAGLNAGRVRIGDPTTGRWLHAYERPANLVSSLAFTPDGGILATGHGATVVFWDVEAGAERGELSLNASEVHALAFSPDGETLAVGDGHGVVRLWPWRRMLGCT
jgi:hypothetical protein